MDFRQWTSGSRTSGSATATGSWRLPAAALPAVGLPAAGLDAPAEPAPPPASVRDRRRGHLDEPPRHDPGYRRLDPRLDRHRRSDSRISAPKPNIIPLSIRPIFPKTARFRTIEELLLVKGVTPALLFGSDINRNGRIDVDEPTNVNMPGVDNSDGSMNQGWSPYLTLYSKEKNLQSNGQPKINLNGSDLQQLSTDLQTAGLNDEQIQFILAYRVYGPAANTSTSSTEFRLLAQLKEHGPPRLPGVQPTSSSSGSSSGGSSISDLITKSATAQISSILDLIGAKVQIPRHQAQQVTNTQRRCNGQTPSSSHNPSNRPLPIPPAT